LRSTAACQTGQQAERFLADARKHLPLVEAALKMLDQGASYDEVRKKFGVPASTLRRYRAALHAKAV